VPELEVSTNSQALAKILLVDDRPENLFSLQAILEPLGEELVLAKSGEEALRQVLLHDFALILLDAEMPGMDGFEVAEVIRGREKTSHVPIIFVTAHGQERKHMFRSYSVGAVDYLPKPFEPDVMRSKVRVFVDLYKKNEQIKQQAALIYEAELREAERKQAEIQESLEREHMKALNSELEKRVEERTAELLAANSEMEAFCYSVSHDLRAPLRAISATSKMLLEDAGDRLNETERGQLQRQSSAANRLARLIDDLLLLSRLGRVRFTRQRVSVTDIARAVYGDVLNREWEHVPDIEIQDELWCEGDPGLVRICIENLLENACKYSPHGGKVKVGAKSTDANQIFYVQDSGIGFDMQYVEKLFKPFERLVTDNEYEGTGIGLAIVQRVVHRHGGVIWAESTPGEGSTFFFSLKPDAYPHSSVQRLRLAGTDAA
jgi:signal transduction histidine kinase